jgi:hypothetical protein
MPAMQGIEDPSLRHRDDGKGKTNKIMVYMVNLKWVFFDLSN